MGTRWFLKGAPSSSQDSLGKIKLDTRSIEPGQWNDYRLKLEDGQGGEPLGACWWLVGAGSQKAGGLAYQGDDPCDIHGAFAGGQGYNDALMPLKKEVSCYIARNAGIIHHRGIAVNKGITSVPQVFSQQVGGSSSMCQVKKLGGAGAMTNPDLPLGHH